MYILKYGSTYRSVTFLFSGDCYHHILTSLNDLYKDAIGLLKTHDKHCFNYCYTRKIYFWIFESIITAASRKPVTLTNLVLTFKIHVFSGNQ